jgi:hypothetical protein
VLLGGQKPLIFYHDRIEMALKTKSTFRSGDFPLIKKLANTFIFQKGLNYISEKA